MDLWKKFCEEMQIEHSISERIPQPLEPLRALYITCQMEEECIVNGDFVNILAVNANRDVFLWENAEILEIDGPKLLFSPDKSGYKEIEAGVLDVYLDRIILIQHFLD